MLKGMVALASNDITISDNIFNLSLENLQNIVVTSASKIEERVIDAPARMVVINKEQIEKRGYKSLANLLSSVHYNIQTIELY